MWGLSDCVGRSVFGNGSAMAIERRWETHATRLPTRCGGTIAVYGRCVCVLSAYHKLKLNYTR